MINSIREWIKNRHFHEWRIAETSNIYQIYTGLGHRHNMPSSMNFMMNEYYDKLIEARFFTQAELDDHLKKYKLWWYDPSEVNVCIICGKVKDGIQDAKMNSVNFYEFLWERHYKSYLEDQKAKEIYKEYKNENDSH